MENISKAVASSKKPTASAIAGSFKAVAESIVAGDLSVATVADSLCAYYGDVRWFDIANAREATDEVGKELWNKFQKPFYTALDSAYKAKMGREYPNKSVVWGRIKSAGKDKIDGTRRLGNPADRTPEQRMLIAIHPRWAEYAKMEALTVRQKDILDKTSALIKAIGHDPQKVDLKALGLKK